MFRTFFAGVVLLYFFLFSGTAFAGNDPLVVLLREDEPFTANLKQISDQTFTGNNPAGNCAYFELLQQARQMALSTGANLIKINKRTGRNQQRPCDELQVSFYYAADVQQYEQHFSWTEDRKLTWDYFKGKVPDHAAQKTAAITSCGIAIETNTVTSTNPAKIFVYNTFQTQQSWVRPEQRTAAILQHEQGHFDICEIYTRKMRARFHQAKPTVTNLQLVIRDIYENTMSEYARYQQEYENDTQHGVIDEAQERWTQKIARELTENMEWKSGVDQ